MSSVQPGAVVVTGVGLVSCLGHDLATVAAALRDGVSGVRVDPERVKLGFRSPLTGVLPPFDAQALIPRKARRAMNEPSIYAAIAAQRALADAGFPMDALRSPEVGVILGNDSTCGASVEAVDQTRADGSTRGLGSSAVVKSMNSAPSINLSVMLGTQGACWTASAACASGSQAIGQAFWLIASGQQDVVLCGGVQELAWESMAAFDGQGSFSVRVDDPTTASRPFDKGRDGLVPSGGGAVLVLESARHAQARDARVRATVRGFSFSSDGHHVTTPSGDGAERCMRKIFQQTGVSPSEVEYVSAHATSTAIGDAVEARAIRAAFGAARPPISSTKGLTGHECWMSGASEVIYALLMAEHGFIAGNNALLDPDDDLLDLDLVRATRATRPRVILSNSFGFGGTNSCLLLQAPT